MILSLFKIEYPNGTYEMVASGDEKAPFPLPDFANLQGIKIVKIGTVRLSDEEMTRRIKTAEWFKEKIENIRKNQAIIKKYYPNG